MGAIFLSSLPLLERKARLETLIVATPMIDVNYGDRLIAADTIERLRASLAGECAAHPHGVQP
jgi:hypothetical protein